MSPVSLPSLPPEHAPYRLHYLGEPALRADVQPVTALTEDVVALIAALKQGLLSLRAVGLAAQHIGGTHAVIVVDIESEPIVMINPVITALADERELGPEGSVSIPGFEMQVTRAAWITVAYNDETFARIERKLTGFPARVVQHEVDHLNGAVLTDGAPRPVRRRAEAIAEQYRAAVATRTTPRRNTPTI